MLGILGMFLLTLSTALGWNPETINGVQYIPMSEVRTHYKLTRERTEGRQKVYEVPEKIQIRMQAHSQDMYMNNMKFILSYPVADHPSKGLMVSNMDLHKIIDPVLRPTYIANRRGFNTVVIDPGHGGTDPGSEGSGLWEYEMTWQVANELVNLLEQDGRYAPVLTITEEESQNSDMPRVEPAERAQRANDAGAVLLFSIHGNSDPSGTASGFECYAIPPGQQYHDESVALARLTAQKITQTGQPLRGQDGVRYIYFDTYDNRMVYESSDETPRNEPTFRLLADADCPAVLVEQCFLTNPQDAARLATPSGAKQAAKAYYEAICEWMEGR